MQTTPAALGSVVTQASENTSESIPVDALLAPSDTFAKRHIGPSDPEIEQMLKVIGLDSLDQLIEQTVPKSIRLKRPLKTGKPRAEHELLTELKAIASKNKVHRSLIGQGYHDTITPPVILRNILENPGWYTAYTPYQAEIAQGRLEALLNFQTMVSDLTGLPVANSSLLDEGTAAAEAMSMARSLVDKPQLDTFFIDEGCHPQTIAVVRTRGESMGIKTVVGKWTDIDRPEMRLLNRSIAIESAPSSDKGTVRLESIFGVLVQYPTTDGRIEDYKQFSARLHANGALLICAADILSLCILTPPGEFGADIAVGSTQRFGVPMGFGGPHAAYMAVKQDFVRRMPGRLVGVSKDAQGNPAYRLTLQTREQHIRRERATSNICTAQVLLAVIAGMYAVYHGPDGLKRIAMRVHAYTRLLAHALRKLGHEIVNENWFDTLRIRVKTTSRDRGGAVVSTNTNDSNARSDAHRFLTGAARQAFDAAAKKRINLRAFGDGTLGISLDEKTTLDEIDTLVGLFASAGKPDFNLAELFPVLAAELSQPAPHARKSPYLTHAIFNTHHSEHELLRYIWKLQSRDISLVHSMIPLGSCTMKLNATSEMIPVTWPEFGAIHPFAPADQTKGYEQMFKDLEKWLCEITGFAGCWLEPNAGSQGEYAGLLMIRAYHRSRNEGHRTICLIPESAHGTNPASAVIAGMSVVPVKCLDDGDIDVVDLKRLAEEHKHHLAAVMITYPSTHGVFEENVKKACQIVHDQGGLVYMDGANMNAQVGLCRPGDIGADVCHLNLHKTFCIPHGGGGPGMGPICMTRDLAKFIPSSDSETGRSKDDVLAVSSAPHGSPSILTISWVYIALMGGIGLRRATQVAILNANYMASRLKDHYKVLFTGQNGRVAHEFIIDCRAFEKWANVRVEDIAKRLMDFGFHAPTMSWPVGGTIMIEPTESESKGELDRLCDALIAIREEIRAIEQGRSDKHDNPLKHAPHTAAMVTHNNWDHRYTREQAAYPLPWVRANKYWPPVARIDNAFGDRNLVCACPPMSDYQ
jgi:glycine dehydrogenase